MLFSALNPTSGDPVGAECAEQSRKRSSGSHAVDVCAAVREQCMFILILHAHCDRTLIIFHYSPDYDDFLSPSQFVQLCTRKSAYTPIHTATRSLDGGRDGQSAAKDKHHEHLTALKDPSLRRFGNGSTGSSPSSQPHCERDQRKILVSHVPACRDCSLEKGGVNSTT
jgi:hypothetical protein